MRSILAFASAISLFVSSSVHAPGSPAIERIVINDNRAAAGVLRNGVLTIQLEAREGEWHPDGESAPGIVVRAFAEKGKPLSIPGPLIRVPEGTEINASVTNTLPHSLVVPGLATRGIVSSTDTITVAPGATREVHFTAGAPGTYYYRGANGEPSARISRPWTPS